MLAPLGGAKGYALALLVEALTGGAVGPALSTSVSDMFAADSAATPQRIAHLVVAMDPMCLSVDGNAEERMDALAAQVTAAGGRLPGATRRTLDGIADDEPLHISPETAAELDGWATSVGISPIRGGKGR
jgi:(2R)-3-sulfolactate dehydrogenase (NADP+)